MNRQLKRVTIVMLLMFMTLFASTSVIQVVQADALAQHPNNKRNILADAKLRAVFGKDEVTMFEMTGLVGKHLS